MMYKKSDELWILLKPVLEEYTAFLIGDMETRMQIMDGVEKHVKENVAMGTTDETADWIKNLYWKVFDLQTGGERDCDDEAGCQGKDYIEDEFDALVRNAIKIMNSRRSATRS